MIWQPKDVVALVALVVLGTLIGLGHDSILTNAFLGVLVVYLGVDIIIIRRRLK